MKTNGAWRVLLIVVLAVLVARASGGHGFAFASGSPLQTTITASFASEPIRDVLLDIGRRFGVTIVIGQEIQGRVSVGLHGTTLDESLQAVVIPLGFVYQHRGNVVIVSAIRSSRPGATSVRPGPQPAVIATTNIPAERVAAILSRLYPHARTSVDRNSSAVIVVDSAENVQAMRTVVAGIDIQSPTRPEAEAFQLRVADQRVVVATLHALYPKTRIATGPNKTVVIVASPQDLVQIKALIGTIDVSTASPAPTMPAAEAVKVIQGNPKNVAGAIAREFPDVRAAVAGSSVVLSGPPDDVQKAKALIALIDAPGIGARFTQVYRLRSVDAQSVGDLISRSYRDVVVVVDKDLNAISVTATASEQQRIAEAVTQLDIAPGATVQGAGGGPPVQAPGSSSNTGTGPGGQTMQVITLKAAIPGPNQGASTTATDIAAAITSFLGPTAPDLHITVPANSNQLMLTGSAYTVRLARQLIDQLDVSPPLVVLDTEILEVDENAAKNIGLTFHAAAISTIFSEIPPTPQPGANQPPPLIGFQAVTRTPISAQFDLNFLIQHGDARVLADPRITTISGHTASIRAGDTSYILTQTGGGAGTIASQQLQPFQTGVTLDITPVVNFGNSISVTLHPTVSSLAGTQFNLPEIATRDTQTTVTLLDNQTLIIGGLIQDSYSRTDTKTPILGDLPIVGRLFHGINVTHTKNELIIVVTPHILAAGENPSTIGPPLPAFPTPKPLPTLMPGTRLPTLSGALPQTAVPGLPTTVVAEPTPAPSPSVVVSAGVFTYGGPPDNTNAGPNDPPKIFYASFSPTALKKGTLVSVTAITTTNINRLTVGYGSYATQLAPVSPGQWQAAYNFIADNLPVGVDHVVLTMTAYRQDGAETSISIPVTINP